MEAHGPATMLRDGVVMLGAALVLVLVFRRLGLGATLGYLVAGVLIGPEIFGLVGGAEAKLGIAELGIALLLFLVGLELSPARLWRLRNDIFGFGLLQVALCGVALTAFVYAITPLTAAAAIAIGLPLALSSTAQVLPMLESAGRLRTPFGQRAFSVLLLQDLSIVPLITIVAALSRAPAPPDAPPGWLLGLYTAGAVVGLVLAGRYILNPLFRLIGGLGERELFVAAGLFAVLASAALMQALGLSSALGAFIAGVMLADSPYRHELEADVEPFRSLLLGLFFVAVGMLLDLGAVMERPLFVLAAAAGLVAIKTTLAYERALHFAEVNEADAQRTFDRLMRDETPPGEGFRRTEARPYTALADHLFHHLVQLAEAHGVPMQIHTGLHAGNGNFVAHSRPADLTNLFFRYPKVTFDLFHIGYPYHHEAAVLAKTFRNVCMDFCWMHVVSPLVARRMLDEMLDLIPSNKIFGFGGDYRYPELSYAHLVMARRNIAAVLAARIQRGDLDMRTALALGRALLHDNPARVFSRLRPDTRA